MVNQVHKFKDRDIRRVVKAARAAGIAIARIEVDPSSGRISVHAREASETSANPWDQALADVVAQPITTGRKLARK